MTTFAREPQVCSVCGTSVECSVLKSTYAFGSPDLDLRPPEMNRSTMRVWLQECSNCGFVNVDLSKTVPDATATLQSDAYKLLRSDSTLPELARRFARYSMLQHADSEASGTALLRAAWACDDAKAGMDAKRFRSQAADILFALTPFGDEEQLATQATVLVDVLRRSERFSEAKELVDNLMSFNTVKNNGIIQSVLRFQTTLCSQGDASCHTVAEANTG